MSKNTGGPAFPAPFGLSHITTQGMTLRDWFAGQAMQGNMPDTATDREIVARKACRMADAMLAEREKGDE